METKEEILSKIREFHDHGIWNNVDVNSDLSLEDLMREHELCKLESILRKNNNLVKPYTDVARICIKSIPGFRDNQEINDLINKHADSFARNINDYNYSPNMSQDDKNELMMLGFLTMAGALAMTRKK